MVSPEEVEVQQQLQEAFSDLIDSIKGDHASLTAYSHRWSQLYATITRGLTSSSFSAPTLTLIKSVAEAVYSSTDSLMSAEEEGIKTKASLRLDVDSILDKHCNATSTHPATKPSPSPTKVPGGPKKSIIPTSELIKLRDWFLENIGDPYLTVTQKQQMVKGTSLDVPQLNNWVNNQRRRSRWTELLKKHADNDKAKMRDLCHRAFIRADTKNSIPDGVMKDLIAMREHISGLYRSEVAQWWPAVAKMIKNMPSASGKGTIGWERKEKSKAEKRALQEAHQRRKEERDHRQAEKARRKAALTAIRQQKIAAVTKPPAYDLRYALPLDYPGGPLPIPSSVSHMKRERSADLPLAPSLRNEPSTHSSAEERPLKRVRASPAPRPPQPPSRPSTSSSRRIRSHRNSQPTQPPQLAQSTSSHTLVSVSSPVTPPKGISAKRKHASDEPDVAVTLCCLNRDTPRPTKRLRTESEELSEASSPSCSPASDSSSLPSLSNDSSSSIGSYSPSPLFEARAASICSSFHDMAESSFNSYLEELSSITSEPVIAQAQDSPTAVAVGPLAALLALDFNFPDPAATPNLIHDFANLDNLATIFDWSNIIQQPFWGGDATDDTFASTTPGMKLKQRINLEDDNGFKWLADHIEGHPSSFPLPACTSADTKKRLSFTGLSSEGAGCDAGFVDETAGTGVRALPTKPVQSEPMHPRTMLPQVGAQTTELSVDPSVLSCP